MTLNIKRRALSVKVEIISEQNKAPNENPIERSFAKVLTYGFSEKSNISVIAKAALNTSVSKSYSLRSNQSVFASKIRTRGTLVNYTSSSSDVVDFKEINQKIINKLGQSNSLKNLPKGVRVVG